MSAQEPGSASDLIDYAAAIIVRKMEEPHTAPYHWAGALWEARMLVAPGVERDEWRARAEQAEARLAKVEAPETVEVAAKALYESQRPEDHPEPDYDWERLDGWDYVDDDNPETLRETYRKDVRAVLAAILSHPRTASGERLERQ